MVDETKILQGSFKSIPIRIISSNVSGGRKFIKKEFPNRDTQTIEDLGLQPRTYDLDIVISDIAKTSANLEPEQDYFDYRDSLISAIEDKGVGVLIHPLYGRVENVIATTYSISENLTDFGISTLSVTLETNDDTGIPVPSATALSQIEGFRQGVDSAISQDITDNFFVNTKFVNNFTAAKNKINDIIQSVNNATSFIAVAPENINEFNRFIFRFSASVNSLITTPDKLAISISNLFRNVERLFVIPEDTTTSFTNLFAFGAVESATTVLASGGAANIITAGLIERKKNDVILNQATNAHALSYAYVSAAQINFETVDEIDLIEKTLELQYDDIVNEVDSNKEVNNQLTDMRVIVQDFFDEQRLSAKQVIVVETNITSARLLSFQYYGESQSGRDIIALNGITDVSFIDGDINILTA